MRKRSKTRRGACLAAVLLLPACAAGGEGPPEPGPVRRIAVTIDDLPVAPPNRHGIEAQRRITAGLLAALAGHGVPAIGFVNENRLERDGTLDPRRVALLEQWLEAGLELGNHTYSHPDLHRVPLAEFLRDVGRGERVTRPLLAARGLAPRYFRHPFLHTGRDPETRRAVEAFLAERGYRVAPVTVDNSEWVFGGAYARAYEAGDREAMRRLGDAYLVYMEAVVAYYEDQSRRLFDREIPQVLLIHAYALNADRLDGLLGMLERRGYRFVSLDEALEDPAYRSADRYTGSGGITWLHRWALTRDVDRSTLAGEPELPAWVRQAAEPGP